MISFILGSFGSNFFESFTNKLQKIKNKKILLIIPEQCSLWAEKKAIQIFNETQVEIEVLSFSRLSHKILQKFGGVVKPLAQKHDKITILNLALFQVREQLAVYKELIKHPDFVELILTTIEQLKNNKTNYREFQKNIENLRNSGLKIKANEFWLIFQIYNLKLSSLFNDPSDHLVRSNEVCRNFKYFENIEIFFTQFFSFSANQLKLIETMAIQTNTYFNFYNVPNNSIFNETSRTIEKINRIANNFNIKTSTTRLNTKVDKTESMSCVENVLLGLNNKKLSYKKNVEITTTNMKNDELKIFSANSIFEETNWAILEILKLVSCGNNFSNITLLTTNLKLYKSAIICGFNKFKIPFFLDESVPFYTMNLIKFCNNLLKIATNTNNCSISEIFDLLKSNLTQFDIYDTALFENYVNTWNLKTKDLKLSFKNHPRGFTEKNEFTCDDKYILIKINKIRAKLNVAIQKIQKSENSSKSISLNLIDALKFLGTEIHYSQKQNSIQEKNKLNMEWNSLILTLDTIFNTTKKTKLNLEQFQTIFEMTSKNLNKKQIPPTLNCVLVGSIEQTMPNNPKTTIILGANEFSLPQKHFLSNQLFSNSDLEELKKINLNLGLTITEQNELNQLMAYRAICSSSHNLFVSFTNTTNGSNSSNEPCSTIKILKNKFKIPMLTAISENLAVLNSLKKQTNHNQTNLKFSENEPDSKKNLQQKTISNKNNDTNNFKLNCFENGLFKQNFLTHFSPSQIELFFTCPFAYFCKYILNIKPNPQTIFKKQHLGMTCHFVLEKVVSLKNFVDLSIDELKEKIELNLKLFAKTKFKNKLYPKTSYKKILNILLILCKNIQIEITTSGFVPSAFETEIKDNSTIDSLNIKINEKESVKIKGKIDRIDLKNLNGQNLIRIIDYKTGKPNLNYGNILNGLNLQMLLYAMAIVKSKKIFDQKFRCSQLTSISYIKVLGNLTSYLTNERNPSNEKIQKYINGGFFQNGLFFKKNNESINTAQELNNQLFLSLTKKDIENRLINDKELNILFNFIETKIKNMFTAIKNFNFAKIEHCTNSNSSQTNCSFCPYIEICNKNSVKIVNHPSNLSKLEFFNLISKET